MQAISRNEFRLVRAALNNLFKGTLSFNYSRDTLKVLQ